MIRLIAGLGNPGPDYAATRHNAGFWFVDELADRLRVSLSPERSYFGMAARANVGGRPVWLLEPTTFMNLSGKSVAALARFFKIEPNEILVAHDELDLMPGQVKLKLGGSHAGHNGLKDIHAQLGSGDYWRLRIGIGHPGVKSEVINYVLKKPSPEHRVEIEKSIEQALSGIDLLLDGDMERATMKINARPPRPKPEKPEKPSRPEARDAERRRWPGAGAGRQDGHAMKRLLVAVATLAAVASGAAGAETIFRCGNEYTNVACTHATTLVVAGAVTPEQRAEARDVARREKTLAAEMTRDRREQEALAKPAHRRLAERAARRGRAAGHRGEETREEARQEGRDRRRARLRRHRPEGEEARKLASAANRAARPRHARTAASACRRRYFAQRVSRDSTFAASSGMHATGQTWTHCGSSKWPTHSVHLRGSMT